MMDQAILEREALRLPAHQRALLADTLLGSLDDEAARKVELAWDAWPLTSEANCRPWMVQPYCVSSATATANDLPISFASTARLGGGH